MTELLDIKGAAAVLNMPWTTLRDKVTARQVPHTRLGKRKGVRFTPQHIAAIIAAGEQPVAAPPGRKTAA